MARVYCPQPLQHGQAVLLPEGAARHVQVLRMQPGQRLTLFNGHDDSPGEFDATIVRMGRSDVEVHVGAFHPGLRDTALRIHLAVGMPANERMDWLVEKATELGVASIQPLMTQRSVLRLEGERAEKKRSHWHSVAVAACEQCGGNRVPTLHPVRTLAQWLAGNCAPTQGDGSGHHAPPATVHHVLSLSHAGLPLPARLDALAESHAPASFLVGPEGGLDPAEEARALAQGFFPTTLGSRVLRTETAALAVLASASMLFK